PHPTPMKRSPWKSHPLRTNAPKRSVDVAHGERLLVEPLETRIALSYSASLSGAAATLSGTAAGDTLTVVAFGGFLVHNRFHAGDGGFARGVELDPRGF